MLLDYSLYGRINGRMNGVSVDRRFDGSFESGIFILESVLSSVGSGKNGFVEFLKSVFSARIAVAISPSSSHIIQELLVLRFVNHSADTQCDDRVEHH